MAGLLVKRFLKKRENHNIEYPTALEEAFRLPKTFNRVKRRSLRNTYNYSKPTHTVQRASILLNEQIDIIDNNVLISNLSEMIQHRESALG